ncbi:hypothetical protein ABBQ38_007760 [Trebouxia sp. C0009 RCD-2024]
MMPQPALSCATTSTSSNTVTRSFTAPAEPAALVDMVQIVPRLLCAETMADLLCTSRQLRCLVHEATNSIAIDGKGLQTQCQVGEFVQALINGCWPCLQILKIRYWVKANQDGQLNLSGYNQIFSCFGVDAMSQLVAGKWSALKHLDVSDNKLDSAAIACLVQADWPLETLHLSNNVLDLEAMEHLVQGSWPRLKQLTLRVIGLTWRSCRWLTMILHQKPLQGYFKRIGHTWWHWTLPRVTLTLWA